MLISESGLYTCVCTLLLLLLQHLCRLYMYTCAHVDLDLHVDLCVHKSSLELALESACEMWLLLLFKHLHSPSGRTAPHALRAYCAETFYRTYIGPSSMLLGIASIGSRREARGRRRGATGRMTPFLPTHPDLPRFAIPVIRKKRCFLQRSSGCTLLSFPRLCRQPILLMPTVSSHGSSSSFQSSDL